MVASSENKKPAPNQDSPYIPPMKKFITKPVNPKKQQDKVVVSCSSNTSLSCVVSPLVSIATSPAKDASAAQNPTTPAVVRTKKVLDERPFLASPSDTRRSPCSKRLMVKKEKSEPEEFIRMKIAKKLFKDD